MAAHMGWIRLDRQILDHWLWTGERFSKGQAWIDLLMLVNFQDCKLCIDGKVIVVPRGSVVTSQAKLAERWQWNWRSVKRFLELLKSDGMISFHCTQKYTFLTVDNYGIYQEPMVSGNSLTGTKTFPDGCTTGYTTDCTTQYTTECIQKKNDNNENKETIHTLLRAYAEICVLLPQGSAPEGAMLRAVETYGLQVIRQAFEKANASSFLTGHNDSGWRADLKWLVRPGNLEKVLSGRFDDRNPGAERLDAFYRMAREFGNE